MFEMEKCDNIKKVEKITNLERQYLIKYYSSPNHETEYLFFKNESELISHLELVIKTGVEPEIYEIYKKKYTASYKIE